MRSLLSGRYEVGEPLGAGGMARVVRAHDRLLDRPVAVKVLDGDRADQPMRERFLREARAAASFSHPNAVAVYDTGQDVEDAFIVMELVEGRTLADELAAHGPLGSERARTVAEAVLAALAAAHAKGLVHRDVKPGNILLPDSGGVKLSDFGIAKSVLDADAGLTATGQLLGTPQYLSPEQVDGQPATARSDLYAVGVVLYEMLAGRPPFSADTPLGTALAHQRSTPEPVEQVAPGVDPALAAVVHRALEKDPGQRYGSAEEMHAALRGAPATVAQPRAVAAATTQVLQRGRARARGWLAPAAAAGLLLVALLAFAATRNQTGPETSAQQPAPEQGPETGPEPAEADEPPEPAGPQADPDPGPPEDLPALIALLAPDPGEAGEKGEDLLDRLMKVARERGGKQRDEAEKAVEKVEEWVEKEELDPLVAEWALRVLEPLRAPPGQRDRDDDGDDD